ncbi:Uncharacterized protein Rs2_19318 [Raphanus sativus]|uniref:Uncharacterized protein LOC108851272 n=1 Tax=Raphanus sativus TaxID=3726 RepID=A0A6J0N7P9_RAPSA|nr:uncharacterized protein LOC108851272 [Raphanus sativus]KAJ4905367.1 Uncharacterized protein Rs2_19318 [Raphanus sativus]
MLPSVQATHHPSSDDNMEDEHTAYSATVHKLIIFIDGGALGLLQVVTNQSPTNKADRGAMILCFWFFTLIYIVLRVFEAKLRNKPDTRNFLGHVSHLFGALASLMLIYLISPSFTLLAVPLWLVWFFVVTYVSFSKIRFPEDNALAADLPV